MLIVISPSNLISDEIVMVHHLLENGLEKFHVRKPELNEEEITNYIQRIDSKYHSKLVLHNSLELGFNLGLTNLHLGEHQRENLTEIELEGWKNKGLNLSTSIHSMKSYEELNKHFDYCFLSPVFDSISKLGYKAMNTEERNFSMKNDQTKIIALGGISVKNASSAFEMGFDGIAVLGSIWDNSNWKSDFNKLRSTVEKVANEEV